MAQAAGGAAAAAAAAQQVAADPGISRRVRETDAPCIVATKKLVASTEGTLSLAQGALPPGPRRLPAAVRRFNCTLGFRGSRPC